MKYYEDDVKQWLKDNPGEPVSCLFESKFPKGIKKFERLAGNLNKFMKEVEKEFPDTTYYLANDVLNLMLGSSHDDGREGAMQQELVVEDVLLPGSSGGDWL